ncbi:MAG: hypothetical protein KKB50_15645 [Planctomycetes bacterium]|nr:hypothetical protein [Planctomycetota bacterium]
MPPLSCGQRPRNVIAGLGLWLLLVCGSAHAGAERPAAVDHSTSKHFPPIGAQRVGDCTCWSSCYYYNTYTQARDEGRDASKGDPDVVCSPRFLFTLIAEGARGAECTARAMEHLADVGCAPVSAHAMTTPCPEWPAEKAWVAALRNRPGEFHRVRADSPEGLEKVKQHIADGGCAVTRGLFHANYVDYGKSAGGPGIDNHVMYQGVGGNHLRHSLCICGYDDKLAYVDKRDGQTHYGAFLIANSSGPDWGWYNSTGKSTKGFLWVAYAMFLEGQFGRYDNDDNPYVDPCFDNPEHPEVYFHDDRPRYRPRLYAAVGINHNARSLLTFSGGIGPTAKPEFTGPEAIQETDHGDLPISDTDRVVVDLTDGVKVIPPGTSKDVFVSLGLAASASQPAKMTSVDFYCDFDGNQTYTKVPAKMDSAVTVEPGKTGYVSVKITNPRKGGG